MTAIAMEPALGTLVRDIVHDHLPGRQTRLVVIAMSKDANPKATVMVFVDGSRSPLLACKVGTTKGACRSVDAEATVLRALAAVDPTMVYNTAPRVLELREAPLGTALVMSACPGVPMAMGYHRWRHTSDSHQVRRDFVQADRWLRQLTRLNGPMVASAHPPERSSGALAVVGRRSTYPVRLLRGRRVSCRGNTFHRA